jgi:hypothetical protein
MNAGKSVSHSVNLRDMLIASFLLATGRLVQMDRDKNNSHSPFSR